MTLLANPTLRLFIGAAIISLSPVWVRLADVAPSTSGFYRLAFGGAALATPALVVGAILGAVTGIVGGLRVGRQVWKLARRPAVSRYHDVG